MNGTWSIEAMFVLLKVIWMVRIKEGEMKASLWWLYIAHSVFPSVNIQACIHECWTGQWMCIRDVCVNKRTQWSKNEVNISNQNHCGIGLSVWFVPFSMGWMSFASQKVHGANLWPSVWHTIVQFFFYLLCWIWFSWNVHRIDMRHWLLILTMMSLLCLILTSIDFVIFFFSRCCFYLSLYFLETLSLKLTIPHSHHSAHFEIKVNKVSFLLPFLTTAINNSFISILYWLVHCVGLHQFNFNVNYE